jgi:hypothetical protein
MGMATIIRRPADVDLGVLVNVATSILFLVTSVSIDVTTAQVLQSLS